MSDTAIVSIVTGIVTIVTLWLKQSYEGRKTDAVDRKAVIAANRANMAKETTAATAVKVDAVLVSLAENTAKTEQVAQALSKNGLSNGHGEDIAELRKHLAELQQSYRNVWQGILARGYVEAAGGGHLVRDGERWVLSEPARQVYLGIRDQLRSLRTTIGKRLGREPTDEEFAWAVEQDRNLQAWLTNHACPTLGVNQHGCLAIACIVARQDEEDTPQPMLRPKEA